jgi:tRNA (uracil-5-)-methyltransferase
MGSVNGVPEKSVKGQFCNPHSNSSMHNTVINNEPFKISYMYYDPDTYPAHLQEKINFLHGLFEDYPREIDLSDMVIVPSPSAHFRNRCRFEVSNRRSDLLADGSSMIEDHNPPECDQLSYYMWDEGYPKVKVIYFPIAVLPIAQLMDPVLLFIRKNQLLNNTLRSVQYLSTLDGQVLVTLCYQGILPGDWQSAASRLQNHINSLHISSLKSFNLIGRSKRKKVVVGSEIVIESLYLDDGRILKYNQVSDGFNNPNATVNAKVLNWVCECVHFCRQSNHNQSTKYKNNNHINALENSSHPSVNGLKMSSNHRESLIHAFFQC